MQQLLVPKSLVKYFGEPHTDEKLKILSDYLLIKSENSTIGVLTKALGNDISDLKFERIGEQNIEALNNDHLITYQYDSTTMKPYFRVFLKHVGVIETKNNVKSDNETIKSHVASKSREYLDFLKSKTGTLGLFTHLAINIVVVTLVFHFLQSSRFIANSTPTVNINQTLNFIKTHLFEMLDYLYNNPVGLKLNNNLNFAMGSFFKYHIVIWKEYVYTIHVWLSLFKTQLLSIIYCLGMAGFTAVLYDLSHLFSLHIYCFYVYARKLYLLFNEAISNLFLLFNGKKFNPLRNRKDHLIAATAPSSIDVIQNQELLLQRTLLGTLLFVVLILLWPTVAVYYFSCKVLNGVVDFGLRVPVLFIHQLFKHDFRIFESVEECCFKVVEVRKGEGKAEGIRLELEISVKSKFKYK